MTKDAVIKEFSQLKGVGKATAELLYNQGFTTTEKLKKASVEDLATIKGITEKNAEAILKQLQEQKIPAAAKAKKEKTTPKTSKEKPDVEPETEVEIVEDEEEEGYKVKKKPELTDHQKELLRKRKHLKQRTPHFLREEWFRYKRIPQNWRRPDGITSKMRINLKYRPSKVRVGFRGPKEIRGAHPSGFHEVLVHNIRELEEINPKKQAARISSTVGTKKRLALAKKAEELDIRILNMR